MTQAARGTVERGDELVEVVAPVMASLSAASDVTASALTS